MASIRYAQLLLAKEVTGKLQPMHPWPTQKNDIKTNGVSGIPYSYTRSAGKW